MNLLDPMLPKVLDMLRGKGVRAFTVEGEKLHVEFDAPTPQAADELKPSPSDGPPMKCKCGHYEYEHQSGLCLHCDPDKCLVTAAPS